ncbi:MAG: 30S ribosomal protein S16 [Armatimonadetes bacterium]|nr:30S ribosomal protein S16 [Armatimonadota bacterium]
MVKIRLRRMGTKGHPFYRIVVAKSTAGRNGAFVEILGTYDPVVKPVHLNLNKERALHWLNNGAKPTETAAVILSKTGVLADYFSTHPSAKQQYKFLDKRTAATSVKSVMDAPAEAPKAAKAAVEEKPVEAAPEATVAEVVAEAPAAEAEAPAAVEEVTEGTEA